MGVFLEFVPIFVSIASGRMQLLVAAHATFFLVPGQSSISLVEETDRPSAQLSRLVAFGIAALLAANAYSFYMYTNTAIGTPARVNFNRKK